MINSLFWPTVPAQFKAGQIVFQEGGKANLFYLIEKGKVVLESKAEFGERVRQ